MSGEIGGCGGWPEPVGGELGEYDGRAGVEEVIADEVDAGIPCGFAGGGGAVACGVDADGAVDVGGLVEPALFGDCGGHGAVVEEVFADPVGEAEAVFGIQRETVVDPLGVAPVREGAVALCQERAGAVDAPAWCEEGVFAVLEVEGEAAIAIAVAHRVPVVWFVIGEEAGEDGVAIAGVEDDHHVIDEVIDVDEDGEGGVAGAVGIPP